VKRGEAVFRAIHGTTAEAQLAMLEGLPRAFRRSLLGHAYGVVLARDVFDVKLRELVAVACLAVLELPRVLKAHALAAERHGATRAQIEETLALVAQLTGRAGGADG
jgi:alkylhydroperoxidase/carboxymuconolactone decarboxylase family protein YurZ